MEEEIQAEKYGITAEGAWGFSCLLDGNKQCYVTPGTTAFDILLETIWGMW